MKITKEYIDRLVKKAGLENAIGIYDSAIEITIPLLHGTQLPEEDGGYQVLAMIIGEALTEVMDLIKKH